MLEQHARHNQPESHGEYNQKCRGTICCDVHQQSCRRTRPHGDQFDESARCPRIERGPASSNRGKSERSGGQVQTTKLFQAIVVSPSVVGVDTVMVVSGHGAAPERFISLQSDC